jgi:murein DD-endopeptidase MepM/ murein hydrolase activator NlpD
VSAASPIGAGEGPRERRRRGRRPPVAREVRLLVVRPAQPVREIRVRPRLLWRAATFGVLALWCLPVAVLAGIATQAREDREQLASDVQELTERTARLSSSVASLERSMGLAASRPDSAAAAAAPADSAPAPAVHRSRAADSWLGDLERRVGTVRGALGSRLRNLPVGIPIVARLSSGFGWRANPFGGGRAEFHRGLDIPSPWGTPVRATADGVVEFAEWRSGYGLAVAIRHADGFMTLFGHLSAATVHAGDRVTRGAVVGRVGNEGRSTGPHVHYEVRRWGKPIDPRRVHVLPTPQPAPPLHDTARTATTR